MNYIVADLANLCRVPGSFNGAPDLKTTPTSLPAGCALGENITRSATVVAIKWHFLGNVAMARPNVMMVRFVISALAVFNWCVPC